MRLSKRMEAVSSLVTPGSILADVGTDHGYIPIALVEQGQVPRAVAMDLRTGPLERAAENIARAGLKECIRTRLSDGVEALQPKEVDSIVIAGMGGEIIIHILDAGREVCRSVKELILQPQSELSKTRKFLEQEKYRIVDEDMVWEDGKFYPIMKVVPEETENIGNESGFSEPEAIYGPILLQKKHPVLLQYLQKEYIQLEKIREGLVHQEPSEKITLRLEELQQKLSYNKQAQNIFYSCE